MKSTKPASYQGNPAIPMMMVLMVRKHESRYNPDAPSHIESGNYSLCAHLLVRHRSAG